MPTDYDSQQSAKSTIPPMTEPDQLIWTTYPSASTPFSEPVNPLSDVAFSQYPADFSRTEFSSDDLPSAKSNRIQLWQIISLWFLSIVITGILGIAGTNAWRSSHNTPSNTATTNISNFKDYVFFGSNYSFEDGRYTIIEPKTTFAASDQLAYVLLINKPFDTPTINRILIRVDQNERETIVDTLTITITRPESDSLEGTIQVGEMMHLYNQLPGTYRLQFTDGPDVLATSTFSYTG